MSFLWHYTCEDHGRAGLGAGGKLLSIRELWPDLVDRFPAHAVEQADLIWLTDLDLPVRGALGLTSRSITCDRIAYRYEVVAGETWPWMTMRHTVNPRLVADLEEAPGAMPVHWYVATEPVSVVYNPIPVA